MSVESQPTVSVVIPTFQEAEAIDACLRSVAAQTYPAIVEVLVVDGRSTDRTRELAGAHPKVRVLDNPMRMQAAALNVGLGEAVGDIIVRVDGHCVLADDYVEACVDALERTGASMVGGAMDPDAHGPVQEGIAAAMASRFGAGPARFHVGGSGAWVDTVYLGAYRREVARAVGGYATDVGVNEDAEFAHRMGELGGVWFDPAIRSRYTPRASLRALAKQFFRYGLSRAATVRRHRASLAPRQLAAPGLLVALVVLPLRRWTLGAYAAGVAVATALDGRGSLRCRAVYAASLPIMHVTWGAGFLAGLLGAPPPRPCLAPDPLEDRR
jgi:succinoglycan biosynthesis protein ExoA